MAKEKRQERIRTIRFREDELRLFEKEAKKKNQTFSEWVRETLKQAINAES